MLPAAPVSPPGMLQAACLWVQALQQAQLGLPAVAAVPGDACPHAPAERKALKRGALLIALSSLRAGAVVTVRPSWSPIQQSWSQEADDTPARITGSEALQARRPSGGKQSGDTVFQPCGVLSSVLQPYLPFFTLCFVHIITLLHMIRPEKTASATQSFHSFT